MFLKKYFFFSLMIFFFIFYMCVFKTIEPLEEEHSFHVLIATLGKDSIFNILKSLKKHLNKNDYLTIVFDGPNLPNVYEVTEITKQMKCNTNVIIEETNLGHWGHAIRNKHNILKGDFVFHVDDDDNITPNCMNDIRSFCKDKNTIYIFKLKFKDGTIIWKTKEINLGNVGTPSGVIPTNLNSTSTFTYKYGGDYDFYKKLEKDGNNIEYVDKIIYLVGRPF